MRPPQKLLFIMKLTTFILMITLAQVSATTFGQRITLNETHSSLEQVLKRITQQSGYNFFYNDADLKGQHIDITVDNLSLRETVRQLFQGLSLDYRIVKNNIVITRKPEASLIEKIIARIESIDVHGTVTDENGRPLAGVSIRLKNNSRFTLSDAKGTFTLTGVERNSVILLSFVGYKTKEALTAEHLDNLKMELADSKLDEVQVIAYGKTSQRLSTGNVVSVSAKDIEKSPVGNPILALQARVPGLTIVQASGQPNAGMKVLIQGVSSLYSGTDPFYVIDGVPYNSSLVNGQSLPDELKQGSPLNFINPNDIESISVLKDADATSIYGSRAANGAILITTKRGQAGPLKVDFNLSQGIGEIANRLKLMNTTEYLAMRREALRNDQVTVGRTDYDLNGTWDTTRNVDWQKELLGRNSNYSNYSLGFSGGDAFTNYSLTTTYRRTTNIQPGDFADQNGSARLTVSSATKDRRFNILFTASYLSDKNVMSQRSGDFVTKAIALAPNAPEGYNPDGTINWALNASGSASWENPYSFLLLTNTALTSNLISSLRTSYEIAKGLQLSANLGYNVTRSDADYITPIESFAPNVRSARTATSIFNHGKRTNWIIEPQLNYKKVTKFGTLGLLAGASMQRDFTYIQNFTATGFASTATQENITAASSISARSAEETPYRYFGAFANLNYNYKDKYQANFNLRRDGSSRFGTNNRYHNFSSVGLGWVWSEEEWAKDKLGPLRFGKLRISYGSTGNDQLPDFLYQGLYSSTALGVAYGGSKGLVPTRLTNPDLQWEETRKLNIGLDLTFFGDRINLTMNYNRNRSTNQLVYYNLPSTVGFGSVWQNMPALIQNKGLEVSISTKNINGESFRWSTNFNITFPKNSLLRYDGIENTQSKNQKFVGESITLQRLYEFAGVNPQTGIFQFRKLDGSLTQEPSDEDMYIHKDLSQRMHGGIENTFGYKGLNLSFLFQFVKQNGLYNGPSATYLNPGRMGYNVLQDALDHWTSPSQTGTFQRYESYGDLDFSMSYYRSSDAAVRDASYIRLKNVNLSWTIPVRWSGKLGINHLQVTAQGQNLLTFTKYNGLDPETLSSILTPPLRVYTLGLKGNF